MISIGVLFFILIVHGIADFVLQTDWQAKNKSSDDMALLEHTVTYSLCWLVMAFIIPPLAVFLFILITFVCHTITDYFTSRLNTKLYKEEKIHDMFVSIEFDQILHYAQLIFTYLLLK